jgi:hypothetical protein
MTKPRGRPAKPGNRANHRLFRPITGPNYDFNEDRKRLDAQIEQDKAFQAALLAAGVPKGVNTSHTDSVPRRFVAERGDVLKSNLE